MLLREARALMAELEVLYEATVGDDEIDELGHMNVRFYLAKALHATQVLAARHGLSPDACSELGVVLELRDVFTRHYREQLAGERLAVKSGVLDVRVGGLRFYHELVNPRRQELAASFVHELELRDRDTRVASSLPEMLAQSTGRALVEWPPHGQPRTLDLDSAPPELELGLASERRLAMRRARVVLPDECDSDGYFIASHYQDLIWGGEAVEGQGRDSWLHDLEDGGKLGWATLESRGILAEMPRAGTRIQSFGAEVALAAKTSFRHQWVYDLDREALLCTSSVLNLAFDIGARRAIEIPVAVREGLEARYHPDLR
jgi:acyl-CoA thioester hydrolase